MSKQQLIGAGLVLGSLASSEVAKYAATANQALGILYLKFSRDDENQADKLGLRYMRRAALNRQPQRVEIVKLERRTTIEALARERPSPVSPATLALINQVDLKTSLEAGRLVNGSSDPHDRRRQGSAAEPSARPNTAALPSK